ARVPDAHVFLAVTVDVSGTNRAVVFSRPKALCVGPFRPVDARAKPVACRWPASPASAGACAEVVLAVAVEVREPNGGVVPDMVPPRVVAELWAVEPLPFASRPAPAKDPSRCACTDLSFAVSVDVAHANRAVILRVLPAARVGHAG